MRRFANFYWKFIRNFSSIAVPLHVLTSSKTLFQCNPQAVKALQCLQESFTSASVRMVTVPLAHAMVRRCHKVWASARWTLLRSSAWMSDCRRQPAPLYWVGQKVWLAMKDLPFQVHSRKLALRFVGLFPLAKVINPLSVSLRLPFDLPHQQDQAC